jgi:hypothetical protein
MAGFSLPQGTLSPHPGSHLMHAGVAARVKEHKKLERLCRYITRPAVYEKHLSLTALGTVRYQFKTPCRESLPRERSVCFGHGTTHVCLVQTSFFLTVPWRVDEYPQRLRLVHAGAPVGVNTCQFWQTAGSSPGVAVERSPVIANTRRPRTVTAIGHSRVAMVRRCHRAGMSRYASALSRIATVPKDNIPVGKHDLS